MYFYLIMGGEVREWRACLRPFPSAEVIIGVPESRGFADARRLSALLSERGLSNRWIPLKYRPDWLAAWLSAPWENNPLHRLLQETPRLVLEAEIPTLHKLWESLRRQQIAQELRLFVPPSLAKRQSDLAAPWQPCQIVSTLP
ncbi:MAG: hypothetical protein RMJ49_07405 [Bacteroidia bacterium]|nr:hypothetical protein [Bacteroidia bacterium]